MLSIIVAHSENFIIGKDGTMPWHLPADLKYFKSVTIGKPVIMGRKTFESIGKALPNRVNIVITRNKNLILSDSTVLIFNSLEEALSNLKNLSEEIFVIGGGSLYKEAIQYADRLYITKIHAQIEGDTEFPHYDINKYKLISSIKYDKDEKNAYDLTFEVYETINNAQK
ncbi:MAG: dihydrofolate reductase [Succinivibrionaceae bacterium]